MADREHYGFNRKRLGLRNIHNWDGGWYKHSRKVVTPLAPIYAKSLLCALAVLWLWIVCSTAYVCCLCIVCVLLWLVCCGACAMATYACAMPVCNGYLCRGECAKWIYDPFNTIRPLEHYWLLPVGDNHLKKDKKVSYLDFYPKI